VSEPDVVRRPILLSSVAQYQGFPSGPLVMKIELLVIPGNGNVVVSPPVVILTTDALVPPTVIQIWPSGPVVIEACC
jgi:hypothetical protein